MRKTKVVVALAAAFVLGVVGAALAGTDFGLDQQRSLESRSMALFGVGKPLAASSTASVDAATADADATSLVTLAKGLHARVVTDASNAGANVDMMALWPNDTHPTWLIACNEQGSGDVGLQRIRISDGLVEDIVASGLTSCDPVHSTPWGTIVFAEENGAPDPTATPPSPGGRLFELIDPLNTTDVVIDPQTGATSGGTGSSNIVLRNAVGNLAFEGIGFLPNGVMYYGDENRPSSGKPGGAYFKFIPSTLWTGGDAITDLTDSPLTSGSIYGLRLGLRSNADFGQGTNAGLGSWIAITGTAPIDLRGATTGTSAISGATADGKPLTGYYRPEDLQLDLGALAAGNVRFCGDNTGNESTDHWYGETICVVDGTVSDAAVNTGTSATVHPEIQQFVIGNPDLAMMDNVAYQPSRGNWVIHEDGDGPSMTPQRNNDLWDCLPDGADRDLLSDGCIRIATINDLHEDDGEFGAEWTGGVFSANGKHLYISVQHNVTGHGVVLDITGWK